MNKKIKYLDTAATTKVDERVLDEMLLYYHNFYGNASSNHKFGNQSKEAIEKSRLKVSELMPFEKNLWINSFFKNDAFPASIIFLQIFKIYFLALDSSSSIEAVLKNRPLLSLKEIFLTSIREL